MAVRSQREIQILHLDDEPDFAALTEKFLNREDDRVAVETATSASEGLEILAVRPPDWVVSDSNMPGTDGIDFGQAARAEYPDLPGILLTGTGSEEVASDASSAGATDDLQKQSGTEQYRLLANRVQNAVTQYRSEQRLHETRKAYTAVFENERNALILVTVGDQRFRYQQCNPRAVELIGRDTTDIVGTTPSEALGPENGQKVVGAYRPCIDQGNPVEYTLTLERPMGRVIRDCDVTPARTSGEIAQLVVEFRDITQQRQRQQVLEEYGTIIEALTDPMYVLDEEGRFTYVNEEFVEMVGYDRESILGNTPSLMKNTAAIQQAEHESGRVVSSDGPETVSFEVRIQPRDGDPIVCEVHMGVLPYDSDQFNGSVGTLRDGSGRKERQRELERIETDFEHARDALFLGDLGEEFTAERVNTVWEVLTGLAAEQARGQTAQDIFAQQAGELIEDKYHECIRHREPLLFEETIRLNGKQRHLVAHLAPIVVDGTVEYSAGPRRDVTDRKGRDLELNRERERYATLFEALPNPVLHARAEDGEPIVETVNPAFEDTFGYDAEAIRDAAIHEYVLPDDRDDATRHLNRRIQREGEVRTEVQRVTTDGVRTFRLTVRTGNADGTSAEGDAVYTDLTEQKQLERAPQAGTRPRHGNCRNGPGRAFGR